jgi:hypothetical protein
VALSAKAAQAAPASSATGSRRRKRVAAEGVMRGGMAGGRRAINSQEG